MLQSYLAASILCTRRSQSNAQYSNSVEYNRSQSMDWVRFSSLIERNRTIKFLLVQLPKKSNAIELAKQIHRIEFYCVRKSYSIDGTQSGELSSMKFGNRTELLTQLASKLHKPLALYWTEYWPFPSLTSFLFNILQNNQTGMSLFSEVSYCC